MDLGFDKRSIYKDLVFALPMKEGTGTTLYDYAKSSLRHTMTATGTPTWTTLANGLQVLDFNSAHPDYLSCSAVGSTDLDFDPKTLTAAFWFYPHSLPASYVYIMGRGLASTDGWAIRTYSSRLYIGRATPSEVRTVDSIIRGNIWQLIVFTSVSGVNNTYLNGITLTPSQYIQHSNISNVAANRKFLIGIDDTEAAGAYDGLMYFPRIWSRALAPEEIMYLFQTERKLLGV